VWRRRKDVKLFYLYGASYFLVNVIFFSASEYRFPMILVLLPAAGGFFVEMWKTIEEKDFRRLTIGCGVYLVALVLCNIPSQEVHRIAQPKSDYYDMATGAVDRGQFIDAVPLYSRSLIVDPNFREARIGLAQTLWRLGNFDDAREEFAAAGVAAPDTVSGQPFSNFLEELYLYTESNDYQGALKFFNEKFPPNQDAPADVWVNRAMVESALNDNKAAINSMLKAAAKDPVSPEYHYKAGQLALMDKDTTRADSFFSISVQRFPAYAPSRVALGELALARRDTAEARNQLDQLRKITIPSDSVKTHVWRLAIDLGQSYEYDPRMENGGNN
jgi:tetratricopeptide (TPR) repeat protein